MSDTVLVIGSGGREHCLAWRISKSVHVRKVFVMPGNAGIIKEPKTEILHLDSSDYEAIIGWCKENAVDLVVIGPEGPLADGVADTLMDHGIPCFGPSKFAAQIESSKVFAKAFMDRHSIPTAKWSSFTDPEEAMQFIRTANFDALVVKASGLAAGKGVVVASTQDEAIEAVHEIMKMKKFGTAGDVVIIEEKIHGEEISVFALSDGNNVAVFPPAQDFKRAFEGDLGPNTGGMGAYCPVPHVSKETLEWIAEHVIRKTILGMKSEGHPFVGLLYAGLMLTKDGAKVLEYNCRFGDPETEAVLALMESDLYETLMECVSGDLPCAMPVFKENTCAVTVVMASGGYPDSYKKGIPVSGLEESEIVPGVKVFHAGTSVSCDGTIVTSGGRVLAVTGMGCDLKEARRRAYDAASRISFESCFYRKDIAEKAAELDARLSYFSSGVDIDAGDALVDAIKPLARLTTRSGVISDLGGFGALFDLRAAGFEDPILVAGTDGVGTKLQIAQACDEHGSVGIDLVAMCVNDVLVQGAEPLFFLDYYACGKLDVATASRVISGISRACAECGCALVGGETAEMPGMYPVGEYDLAGFAVGAVERPHLLPNLSSIGPGDVLVGLASSGLHSNGFSLVRKVVQISGWGYKDPSPFSSGNRTLGEELLTPTRLYVKPVLPLIKAGLVKAFAHITGGGLLENIPRVLPSHVSCVLDSSTWDIPPVFGWLASVGNVHHNEMLRAFNCGLGGVLVVAGGDADTVLMTLNASGEKARLVGSVRSASAGQPRVLVQGFQTALGRVISNLDASKQSKKARLDARPRMRVGVLISGTGTNLQALIDQSLKVDSAAEIVIVISNKAGVQGLSRAEKAGILSKVVSHKDFATRQDFDARVNEILEEHRVDLVFLAGFMRILSGDFVRRWRGRLVNVHPSLLPAFKGMHAHKLALEAGVRVSGCTVHFVEEEVDTGGIILQETVPVLPGDSEESLQERVKSVEHVAYPKAMELLASGKVRLLDNGKVAFT